jgi:hypothetical protein
MKLPCAHSASASTEKPELPGQLVRRQAGGLLGVADRLREAVVAQRVQAPQHPGRVGRDSGDWSVYPHVSLRCGREERAVGAAVQVHTLM